MYVIKRKGQKEEVNPQKIKNAISAAFKAKSYTLEDELIDKVVEEVKLWNDISIEDVQDEILEVLRDYGYDDVAETVKVNGVGANILLSHKFTEEPVKDLSVGLILNKAVETRTNQDNRNYYDVKFTVKKDINLLK